MLTWGEIRVGYYVLIVVLTWLFNGTPSAIFLAILLALFFERDFKRWVFSRFEVAGADKAVVRAMSTAKATAQARGKANDEADKSTAKKPTTRKTPAKKPKAAAVTDD